MNWANRLSILRICFVPVFIISLVYYRPENDHLRIIAIIIFAAAVLTDAIDGLIARLASQKTALGSFLDPLADKLLLISSFICLAMTTNFPAGIKFPAWVPIIVITRDLIIIVGCLIIYLITGKLKIAPSILGKVTTFFQMSSIIAVLVQFSQAYYVWNIAIGFTVLSGIDYVIKGTRFLNGSNKS